MKVSSLQGLIVFLCITARLWYEENSDFSTLPVVRICKLGLSELSSVMLHACEYGFLRKYLGLVEND